MFVCNDDDDHMIIYYDDDHMIINDDDDMVTIISGCGSTCPHYALCPPNEPPATVFAPKAHFVQH